MSDAMPEAVSEAMAMDPIMNPAVVEYAEEHSTPPPDHLATVDAATRSDFASWFMMVGRQEGRFLELLVFATGASTVLEVGTFTGYSALAMAAGLAPGGHITTLEVDPKHAATARANIAASPYAERITVVEGPALESINQLEGPFDLVFIDADKTGYDAYYEAVLPKLSERGLILCDNTLYSGQVLLGADGGAGSGTGSAASGGRTDDNAAALRRFNDKVVNDPRVVCALTTIRDGVTLIRRAGA
jgi:caffeoyl-CoA O-methyltransferase